MATCPICGESFGSQYEIDVHVQKYHPGDGNGGNGNGGDGNGGGNGEGSPARLMYCVGAHSDFDRVASAGINVVQNFEFGSGDWNFIRNYLDTAQAHGLKVLYWIGHLSGDHFDGKSPGEQWAEWNRLKEGFITEVEEFKDHPALWGWYWSDEINLEDREIPHNLQQDIYDTIKSIDPDHPVIGSMAAGRRADQLNFDAMDILTTDIYPYGAPAGLDEIWWGGRMLKDYLDDNNIDVQVLPIVQACSHSGTGWQGNIKAQIDAWGQIGLLGEAGLGMWAWGDNVEGGADSDRTLNEVANAWPFSVEPWDFEPTPEPPQPEPQPEPIEPEPEPQPEPEVPEPTPEPEPPEPQPEIKWGQPPFEMELKSLNTQLDQLGTNLMASAKPYLGKLFPERQAITPPELPDVWGKRPYEATWLGEQQQTWLPETKPTPTAPEAAPTYGGPLMDWLRDLIPSDLVPQLQIPSDIGDWWSNLIPSEILGEDFYSQLEALGNNLILSATQTEGLSNILGGQNG